MTSAQAGLYTSGAAIGLGYACADDVATAYGRTRPQAYIII